MKVLVTGGSGFVGSHIIKSLLEAHPEWTIHNLDRTPGASSEKQYVQVDITDQESVTSALESIRPEVVVHTAGVSPGGQARYSNAPAVQSLVFSINRNGTKNMLEASRAAGVKAFVYTSSCTVISDDLDNEYPLMNETIPTGRATLAYGSSKAAAEKLVLAANDDKMATCALRPSIIIGPGDDYGVIDTIYELLPQRQTPFIIGDGHNMCDITYVDNIAHAHVLAVDNLLASKSAAGLAMFISNQEPVYFRDFMCAIWAQCDGHAPPYQIKIPKDLAWAFGLVAECVSWLTGKEALLSRGSVKDAIGTRYSDNTRAIELLGYKPKVKFSEGVRLACEDFKERRSEGKTRLGKRK